MRFKRKKTYGQYKTAECPFCGKQATQKNEEGIEVCRLHTKEKLPEIKCTCGSWLELRVGKFGPYFNCLNCGNINFEKGKEMEALQGGPKVKSEQPKPESREYPKRDEVRSEPKEITISTDDVEYFS